MPKYSTYSEGKESVGDSARVKRLNIPELLRTMGLPTRSAVSKCTYPTPLPNMLYIMPHTSQVLACHASLRNNIIAGLSGLDDMSSETNVSIHQKRQKREPSALFPFPFQPCRLSTRARSLPRTLSRVPLPFIFGHWISIIPYFVDFHQILIHSTTVLSRFLWTLQT